MRLYRLQLLALVLGLAACSPSDAGGTVGATSSTTEAGTITSGTDAPTTGIDAGTSDTAPEPTEGTTGEPDEDLNPYTLGDHASQACLDAMVYAADFIAASAVGDVDAANLAFYDGPLQGYLMALDKANKRDDDGLLESELSIGDAAGLAVAEGSLQAGLLAELSLRLGAINSGSTKDKYAAWDEAYCVWDGSLRLLATRAQSAVWVPPGDPMVADIDAAFASGHDGISGEVPSTQLDEWRVLPRRQIIEKTFYRALHRDAISLATLAAMNADKVAAFRAFGVITGFQDLIAARNSSGIEDIQTALGGDPAMISAEFIARELDIAFAKYAIDIPFNTDLGTPQAYEAAVEGRAYAQIIAPGMGAAALDAEALLTDWDEYVALARTNADPTGSINASKRILKATCAYQAALGIAACTATDDEP